MVQSWNKSQREGKPSCWLHADLQLAMDLLCTADTPSLFPWLVGWAEGAQCSCLNVPRAWRAPRMSSGGQKKLSSSSHQHHRIPGPSFPGTARCAMPHAEMLFAPKSPSSPLGQLPARQEIRGAEEGRGASSKEILSKNTTQK